MQVRLSALLTSLTVTLAYFLAGLSSSFLFWLGLLFAYPLYSARITLFLASLTLVLIPWIAQRKFGSKSSMAYSTTAFVGGGTISSVGVWSLYLWWQFVVSTIGS